MRFSLPLDKLNEWQGCVARWEPAAAQSLSTNRCSYAASDYGPTAGCGNNWIIVELGGLINATRTLMCIVCTRGRVRGGGLQLLPPLGNPPRGASEYNGYWCGRVNLTV